MAWMGGRTPGPTRQVPVVLLLALVVGCGGGGERRRGGREFTDPHTYRRPIRRPAQ